MANPSNSTGDGIYRLKSVKFRGRECNILLQNENGPCPLLAAANALLLQEKVKLPASSIRNNVASLSDLTNVLANFAMHPSEEGAAPTNMPAPQPVTSSSSSFLLDELLKIIPKLQYGMDVNPKFTDGITGYEFTQELTCFDSWQVKLVHGWLLDPTDESLAELFQAVGNKTYNELIEHVIQGKEADMNLPPLEEKLTQLKQQYPANPVEIAELEAQVQKMQSESLRANYIDHFLSTTGHQLTQFGLTALHQDLKEEELVVFFRNNHFCTMTKNEGNLFLLVTDLGYANTPMVVWERLDVIDGDTEYVNSQFLQPGQIAQSGSSLTPEQLMAQSGQNDADYHLALHLSMQPHGEQTINANSQAMLDTEEGKLMAAATEASLREFHGEASPPGTTTVALPPITEGTQPPIAEMGVPVAPPPPAGTQESADEMLAQQLAKEMAQEQQLLQQGQAPLVDDEKLARRLQEEQQGNSFLNDDERLARQLQAEAAAEDERLARQLQEEENNRGGSASAGPSQQQVVSSRTTTTTATRPSPQQGPGGAGAQGDGKCTIS